jgi:hypothetical protein
VGVARNANQDDINKAYRKKSKLMHPDKVKQQFIADKSTGKGKSKDGKKKPGANASKGPTKSEVKAAAKKASDRFARLGLVTAVLRGEGRDRYDHFLSNGFPAWKGTGYYYARFRPGLGTVLAGLFVFVGGGGHWFALYMSWHRQQEFVQRYIKFARHAAWGDNLGIPGVDVGGGSGTATPATGEEGEAMAQPVNRKQRRQQEKDARKDKVKKIKSAKTSPAGTPPIGATGPRKRVVAENGKVLVVDSAGQVYLEQADEDGNNHEFLLDVRCLRDFIPNFRRKLTQPPQPNEFPRPTLKDTAFYRLPAWAFNRTVGRLIFKAPVEEQQDGEDEVAPLDSSSGAEDFEVLEKVKSTAPNGNGKSNKRNKRTARNR